MEPVLVHLEHKLKSFLVPVQQVSLLVLFERQEEQPLVSSLQSVALAQQPYE